MRKSRPVKRGHMKLEPKHLQCLQLQKSGDTEAYVKREKREGGEMEPTTKRS